MSLSAIVLLGFFLGMRHATDPDHVVAVSTIVTRHRQRGGAAKIGALWGLGHTLTILVVGGGIILLGWVIPPRLGLSLELAVGGMLIVLGLRNLSGLRATASATHVHPHAHGDYVHSHAHQHNPESHPHTPEQTPLARLDHWLGSLGGYQAVRPIVVGIVHGLAGSAAVALLILTVIRDPLWSILYLLVFGLGTIGGMMLVTAAVAWPFARMGGRYTSLDRGLRLASGLVSLGFGLVLAYKIGVVDGLFGASPDWMPR